MFVHIRDPDDARLADYRRLRERDKMRAREGLFVLEGGVVLDAALDGGRFPLRSVLVTDRRQERWAAVLANVPDTTPVFVVPHEHVESLAGFDLHKGLVAIGERGAADCTAPELLASLGRGRRTVLVMVGLTNTDNVGACFRNAAAFGVDGLLLDATCCDPLYRRAIRVSVGHAVRIPFAQAPLPEIVAALRVEGFHLAGLGLRATADVIKPGDKRLASRLAVLLGPEGEGLPEEVLDACHSVHTIPMQAGVDSLNVATAGALALWAWSGAS